MNKKWHSIWCICICILFVCIAGCSAVNKYSRVTVSDKFTNNEMNFIAVTDPQIQIISVSKFCQYNDQNCYNVFIINRTYDIQIGEPSVFADGFIVRQIIREVK